MKTLLTEIRNIERKLATIAGYEDLKKNDPVAYMHKSVKSSRKKRGPVWSDVYAHEAEERLDAHHGAGWFKKLTKDQQLDYLKLHPASKYKASRGRP